MAADDDGRVQEDEEIALALQQDFLGPCHRALSCGCILFVICSFPNMGWWYVPDHQYKDRVVPLHSLNCPQHLDQDSLFAAPWQQYTSDTVIGWINPNALDRITGRTFVGNVFKSDFLEAWHLVRHKRNPFDEKFIRSAEGSHVIAMDGGAYLVGY